MERNRNRPLGLILDDEEKEEEEEEEEEEANQNLLQPAVSLLIEKKLHAA
jgi:hypothetical protein